MATTLHSALEALLPTDEEVAIYREHGYYVSRNIFTRAEGGRKILEVPLHPLRVSRGPLGSA